MISFFCETIAIFDKICYNVIKGAFCSHIRQKSAFNAESEKVYFLDSESNNQVREEKWLLQNVPLFFLEWYC